MEVTRVKEDLDSTLLQYFEVLEQFYQAQARLEAHMSSGLINMSRARYNMGVKAVTISQVHEDNMVASVKVQQSPPSSDSSQQCFQLISVTKSKEDVKTPEDTSPEKDSGLRQRKAKEEDPQEEPSVEDVGPSSEAAGKATKGGEGKEKTEKNEGGNGIVDPLRWFGVLVPQTLRQSQADFRQAVEVVGEVANLKQQLVSLTSTYRQLLKQKADLVAKESVSQE